MYPHQYLTFWLPPRSLYSLFVLLLKNQIGINSEQKTKIWTNQLIQSPRNRPIEEEAKFHKRLPNAPQINYLYRRFVQRLLVAKVDFLETGKAKNLRMRCNDKWCFLRQCTTGYNFWKASVSPTATILFQWRSWCRNIEPPGRSISANNSKWLSLCTCLITA